MTLTQECNKIDIIAMHKHLGRKLTKAESGSLGGLETFRRYGRTHMQRIGHKGGEAYNRKYIAGGQNGSVPDDDSYSPLPQSVRNFHRSSYEEVPY